MVSGGTHGGEASGGEQVLAPPIFAHPSERVAAEILDFYGIAWEYEPTTFPIEWSGDGRVIMSFTPDFYLPQFDLYIELTTMSQKLVTKKNRKVRKVRELYPEVNIKIFYQKDFRRLLQRFGLEACRMPLSAGGGLDAESEARDAELDATERG